MIRYLSVGSTSLDDPSERRRFALFVASKCRLPARERITLPEAVILNRLATAFRVLFPFGRRITQFLKRAWNIGSPQQSGKDISGNILSPLILPAKASIFRCRGEQIDLHKSMIKSGTKCCGLILAGGFNATDF